MKAVHGVKGWATSLSLQPSGNKNIAQGETKIKRKDNIQSLKENAQRRLIHELLVHSYAACKKYDWHIILHIYFTEKFYPIFLLPQTIFGQT